MTALCLLYNTTAGNTTQVTYTIASSEEGLADLLANEIQFAVVSSPPNIDLLESENLQILPLMGGAKAIIYNFNGSADDGLILRISQEALVSIYRGEVTYWDDPAISITNPDTDLPHMRIIPFHRFHCTFISSLTFLQN